jgi:molecular chaperone IbpA
VDGAGSPAPLVSMLLREEDVEMRTEFDFSPLFRSTVGFDRMFDRLQHSTRGGPDEHHTYPPYDIERTGEDSYRVTLAVAGFRPEELTVTAQQNLLLVTGDKRAGSGGGEQQRQVL